MSDRLVLVAGVLDRCQPGMDVWRSSLGRIHPSIAVKALVTQNA
jgi:hypothetical protein